MTRTIDDTDSEADLSDLSVRELWEPDLTRATLTRAMIKRFVATYREQIGKAPRALHLLILAEDLLTAAIRVERDRGIEPDLSEPLGDKLWQIVDALPETKRLAARASYSDEELVAKIEAAA